MPALPKAVWTNREPRGTQCSMERNTMHDRAEHFVRKGGSRLVECRDPSFSCQNLKSVMDASSHGPMTAGPVERPPAPPAASHSRRRTRSMSAHESLTGERDGSALVAPTLTDHQGDVACDDPHSKSPEPIPRCARVPDPRAHLDDTDAQPADPLPSDGACQRPWQDRLIDRLK